MPCSLSMLATVSLLIFVSQVVNRVADFCVYPQLILFRHFQHQFDNFLLRCRPTYPSGFARIIFLCNQCAKPTKQCLWGCDIGNLLESSESDLFRFRRQTTTLFVIETRSFAVNFLEHANLLALVVDYRLLFPIKPTGKTKENEFIGIHGSIMTEYRRISDR